MRTTQTTVRGLAISSANLAVSDRRGLPYRAKMVSQSLVDRNEDVMVEAARSKLEMTPGRAVETVEGLGLGGVELAGALGASARTVERWRAGQTYPQHEARERLARLVAVEAHLVETFDDPESRRAWLRSAQPLPRGAYAPGGSARRPDGPGGGCPRGSRLRHFHLRLLGLRECRSRKVGTLLRRSPSVRSCPGKAVSGGCTRGATGLRIQAGRVWCRGDTTAGLTGSPRRRLFPRCTWRPRRRSASGRSTGTLRPSSCLRSTIFA